MSSNVIPRIKPIQVEKLGKDIATTSYQNAPAFKEHTFPYLHSPVSLYSVHTIPSSQAFLLL